MSRLGCPKPVWRLRRTGFSYYSSSRSSRNLKKSKMKLKLWSMKRQRLRKSVFHIKFVEGKLLQSRTSASLYYIRSSSDFDPWNLCPKLHASVGLNVTSDRKSGDDVEAERMNQPRVLSELSGGEGRCQVCMLATGSARLNASNGTLPLPSNVRSSEWEAKSDFGQTCSSGLRSDSTSGRKREARLHRWLQAFPSGHPHAVEAS